MAYTRGESKNIIVGAAAIFAHEEGPIVSTGLVDFEPGVSFKETLSDPTKGAGYRNVGYTTNGLELMFQPDFGEVKVDQLLDVAKLFKQGMQVSLKTSFAEATLENLLLATAGNTTDLSDNIEGTTPVTTGLAFDIKSGELGAYPLERGIVAVGASVEADAPGLSLPTSGAPTGTGKDQTERVYTAYRALSIENVTVSSKRDAATEFEVTFRLLPDSNAAYGKIVDRTY